MSGPRAAVFLDRDGTINVDTRYVRSPDDVALVPGAAGALARLNAAAIPVIVVTNQSGIARGLLTAREYDAVQVRLEAMLAGAGAHVDATYVCPHDPTQGCECRKPGTLLFRRAAAEHAIALDRSWFLGDRWRDVAPALELGGTGILIPSEATPRDDLRRARADLRVSRTLERAVDLVLRTASGAR